MIDCWREQNLEKKQYTWFKGNPLKKARLDYFFISNTLFTDIAETFIVPGYRSDHSIIVISLKLGSFKAGKSYWKFNNSLLKDAEYVQQTKLLIQRIKTQYATEPQNRDGPVNEINNANIVFSIDDKLFLETLLMEIRGQTISFATFKKRQECAKEAKLIQELESLQQSSNMDDQTLLVLKQQELLEIRKKRLEGSLVRSRAKWVLEGEKPSKYFCNLENRHFVSKHMASLYTNTGNLIFDQNSILNETKNHYKNLYSYKETKSIDLNNIFENIDVKKLSDSEKIKLEGPISKEEALFSLKRMSNDTSPGINGFTAAFF